MARRLVIGLVLVLAVVGAVGTASADVYTRKQNVDAQLSDLRDRIAAARARESELQAEIAAVSSELQALNHEVRDVSARLAVLERDLELHRRKLARLTELFRVQTQRLIFLREQYAKAVQRLDRRLVAIYEAEEVGTLEVVLSSSSFSEMLDRLDYMKQIGVQDKTIAEAVEEAKIAMRIAREKTRKTKRIVAAATRTIAVRTAEVRALRNQLLARQSALAAARSRSEAALGHVHASAEEMIDEAAALEEVSSTLAGQIRAAQAAAAAAAASSSSPSSPSSSPSSSSAPAPSRSTGSVSSSGFIWPVGGSVVSGFGYRCLGGICRMHEGVDIAAPYGAPIHAAASGTVISASWMGGYGNIIVIDHGGGLSTAYAHQSSFAVGGGSVSQGQVIGYVGCTGRCFGPHLHFEVRVNGSAVDPLGYL